MLRQSPMRNETGNNIKCVGESSIRQEVRKHWIKGNCETVLTRRRDGRKDRCRHLRYLDAMEELDWV